MVSKRVLLGLSDNIATIPTQSPQAIRTRLESIQDGSIFTVARLAGPFDLMIIAGFESENIIQCALDSKEKGHILDWRFEEIALDSNTDILAAICSSIINILKNFINMHDNVSWSLTIDVTGETQVQLAMLTAIRFLSTFYHIEIERVLQVAYSQIGALIGLIDMTQIFTFLNWIEASNRFIEDGHIDDLVHLIHRLKDETSYSKISATELEKLADALLANNNLTRTDSGKEFYPISKELYTQFERAIDAGAFDNLLKLVIDEIITKYRRD